jgi:integrase
MAIHRLNWSKARGWTHDGKPLNPKKHMHCDGNGLYLATKGGNSESWIRRYSLHGRKKQIGLGPFKLVTLEQARAKAVVIGNQVLDGKDPKAVRENARITREIEAGRTRTFGQVLDEYRDDRLVDSSSVTKKVFKYQRRKYLDRIADISIRMIDTNIHILDNSGVGLREAWEKHNTAAKSLISTFKGVFEFAIAKKYRDDNPAAWVGCLKPLLRRASDVHTVESYTELPYEDMFRYVAALRACEDKRGRFVSSLLLEFHAFCCVRVKEVRLMTWSGIDPDMTTWTVPWQHLKTGKKHKTGRPVPISEPMRKVLDEMQRRRTDFSDEALVFPSPRTGRPYNDAVLSQFLDRVLKWTPKFHLHGLRGTLRNWCRAVWCRENYNDLWNIQADHVLGDKNSQAYGKDKLLEQRRVMMDAWAKHCTRPTPAAGTNVAQITEARKRRRAS